MLVILKLLARPLIEAAVSAFGQVIIDFFASWRAHEDAKAVGRAEAERAAIIAADAAEDRMEKVMPLSDEEIIRRLREGKA
jgi:hypothetical protein